MDIRPIGMFDSGSGGLSVFLSTLSLLPQESIEYIGDNKYLPYGEKSASFIRQRTCACIRFLLSKNVKLVVVACNAATVAGIDLYRKTFPQIPIIGVVPVVKTAGQVTRTNTFAVLSTLSTAKSAYQKKLIVEFAPHCVVFSVGSSKLVRLIEEGKKDTKEVRLLLEKILQPLVKKNIDVCVLGCTHFPFLRPVIEDIVGNHVSVLDSGDAVGRHVMHILDHEGILSSAPNPSYRFYTTGNQDKVMKTASLLLGRPLVVTHTEIYVQ